MDRTNWLIYFSIMVVIIVTQAVNGDTTKTGPKIKYVCDAQGTVNISTDNIYGSYSMIGVLRSPNSNKTCSTSPTVVLGKSILLTGCKLNDPIFVYIMKENIGRIYGGHEFHEYVINCTIPNTGVVLNATAKLEKEATPAPVPETEIASLSLTMSITPNKSVNIGEKLRIEIRISNQIPYTKMYILPESCDATYSPGGGGSTPAPLHLLQKQSAMPVETELIKTFTIANNGSAITTAYAFRFIESPTIILQCKVHVCKDKSCNGNFTYYASPTPTTSTPTTTAVIAKSSTMKTTAAANPPVRRRRRASEQTQTHPQTHIVKAMFSVMEDHRKSSGQASIGVCTIGMIGMLLVKPVLDLL